MTKKIEFQLPQGFSLPEGKTTGDDIEVMCTLTLQPNGTACLTRIGDLPLPGGEEPRQAAPAETEAPKSEFITAYQNSMEHGT